MKAKNIKTKSEYDAAIKSFHTAMRKGEKNLSEKELEQLKAIAEAAEKFEDFHLPLPEQPIFLK